MPKRAPTGRKSSKAAAVKPAKSSAKPTPKAASKAAKPKAAGKKTAKTSKPAKAAKKGAPKATTKPAKAPAAKKPSAKPAPAKSTKPAKAPEPAPAPPPVAAPAPAADDKKGPRKPMTVVGKGKRAKAPSPQMPQYGEPLFRPGAPAPKPLIASGPKAAPASTPLGPNTGKPIKSPLDKKQIEHFRIILLQKRAELVGDINTMENEALMSQSGALSHLPQHMAEQGSDVYGQSLSLDLAAVDRRLIKDIDDALIRIQQGVYGICELTGKPIKLERLQELPWARYSIEAARELERRGNTQ